MISTRYIPKILLLAFPITIPTLIVSKAFCGLRFVLNNGTTLTSVEMKMFSDDSTSVFIVQPVREWIPLDSIQYVGISGRGNSLMYGIFGGIAGAFVVGSLGQAIHSGGWIGKTSTSEFVGVWLGAAGGVYLGVCVAPDDLKYNFKEFNLEEKIKVLRLL